MEDFIHSLFQPKFNAGKEINRLWAELRTINELKSLSTHPGWKKLKRWVVDKVVQYDQSIVTLSNDVERNKKEIEFKRQFRDALLWTVNQVDSRVSAELELQERIKFLAETAHDLEPEDLGQSGVELQRS